MGEVTDADGAGPFSGFGGGAMELFAELEDNNERAWWHANKDRYETEIAQPMQRLARELGQRFGAPVKVFRPQRDVRFSADKRPIKEHAALAASPDGPVLYLEVSADGLVLAGGWWRPERPQLDAWRRLVADPAKARGLRRHLAGLDGFTLAEPSLKQAPRGYRRDHPEIGLLRVTSLTVRRSFEPGLWLCTAASLDRVVEGWSTLGRWNAWLMSHVPAAEAPAVPGAPA